MTTKTPAIMARINAWMMTGVLMLSLAAIARAQSTSGVVRGRVYDTSSAEYLRNAEVYIDGTQRMVLTEDGGYYVFTQVPAGEVKIEVRYTGLATQSKTGTVTPGKQLVLDFELVDALQLQALKAGDLVQLEKLVVSSAKEGTAKALQIQKNSMNMANIIATDDYGDLTGGNVGEFLQYIPGINLDYVEADTRYASIGGMDSKYVGVTMDGASIASANSSAFNADSRKFSFEQFSIKSVATVNVMRAVSADMRLDKPAGTINLTSRSAFDQKGRMIDYQLYVVANSYYPNFSKSAGPGDYYTRKTRPGFEFNYSESFLSNRLGIRLNLSRDERFSAQNRLTNNYTWPLWMIAGEDRMPYDTPSTEALPYVNRITYKDGPKITRNDAASLRVDYKISPFSKIALSLAYSTMEDEIHNRTLDFRTSGQNATNSSATHVFSTASGYVDMGGQSMMKYGDVKSVVLRGDTKFERFTLEGSLSHSMSSNTYEDMSSYAPYARHMAYRAAGIGWTADRPDSQSTAWTIVQTNINASGTNALSDFRAWAPNGAGWIQSQYKHSETTMTELRADLTWSAPTEKNIWLKTGFFGSIDDRNVWDPTNSGGSSITDTWAYRGPTVGGNKLDASFISPFHFDAAKGGNLPDLNIPYPSRNTMYKTFVEHPDWFERINKTGDLLRELAARKDLKETTYAGYIMGFIAPHPRIAIMPGLRYEYTTQEGNMIVPVTRQKMQEMGWGDASADSNPEYIRIQYRDGQREKKTNNYGFLLPTVAVKYQFTKDLQGLINYYSSYQRVDVDVLTGEVKIDDAAETARLPNPRLKPDKLESILANLEYYYEPNGLFGFKYTRRWWYGPSYELHELSQREIDNMREIYGDQFMDDLGNYRLSGYNQDDAMARNIQTLEFEWRQRLPFLKQISVVTTFSRNIPNWRQLGTARKSGAFSIRYNQGRLSAMANCSWMDRIVTSRTTVTSGTDTYQHYRTKYARFMTNLNINYRITGKFGMYIAVRNIFNERQAWYELSPEYMVQHEQYGANITFGVKGSF